MSGPAAGAGLDWREPVSVVLDVRVRDRVVDASVPAWSGPAWALGPGGTQRYRDS